jgi:hypothetical protein
VIKFEKLVKRLEKPHVCIQVDAAIGVHNVEADEIGPPGASCRTVIPVRQF